MTDEQTDIEIRRAIEALYLNNVPRFTKEFVEAGGIILSAQPDEEEISEPLEPL